MNSNNAVEQGAARDPLLGRAGRGARRARAIAGCSRTAAPTRTTTTSCRTATTSAARPAMRVGGRGAARAGGRRRRRPRPRRPLLLLPVGGARSPPPSSASALDRPLTVTGGLSFAGGPWNNYVMHSIATMAGVLRDDAGASGLVHRQRRLHHQARLRRVQHRAAGRRLPPRATPQAEVDALPARAKLAEEHDGEVTDRGVDA